MIPLKEVRLNFGNILPWSLARQHILNVNSIVILKTFRSEIENKGSLKVEEAILWFLVQSIKRQQS